MPNASSSGHLSTTPRRVGRRLSHLLRLRPVVFDNAFAAFLCREALRLIQQRAADCSPSQPRGVSLRNFAGIRHVLRPNPSVSTTSLSGAARLLSSKTSRSGPASIVTSNTTKPRAPPHMLIDAAAERQHRSALPIAAAPHLGAGSTAITADRSQTTTYTQAHAKPDATPQETSKKTLQSQPRQKHSTTDVKPTLTLQNRQAKNASPFPASPSLSVLRDAEEWRLDFTQRRVK